MVRHSQLLIFLFLAATYFAMEQAILQPRFQAQFAPGALSDAALPTAVQRRAGVALAMLENESAVEPVDPRFQLSGYDLMADSRIMRNRVLREAKDTYFRWLSLGLLALTLIPSAYWIMRAGIAHFFFWLPLALLAIGLCLADVPHDNPGLFHVLRLTTVTVSFGIGWFARNKKISSWECLTITIIWFILMAILFPVFARARENARKSTPASMLRQVQMQATMQQREQKTKNRVASSSPDAPRLREFFPETMLWQPEVITDDDGKAEIALPIADSITDWRITAQANDGVGRFGSSTGTLRVFQEFFIDPDLPVALTQGDWIELPIAIHNYLPTAQRVTVKLASEDAWFNLSGGDSQTVTVAARDVSVARFPLKALRFGKHRFTITATNEKGTGDAVAREIEVLPDGREMSQTKSDRLTDSRTLPISIPANAIPGSQKVLLQIHPGTFSQVVSGLDSMLQAPYGCFEQTSSTLYPNILILDYLKRSKRATPDVQMRAEQFISQGYQRILTFETPGGGFDWFGTPPGKTVLTALGVMELTDMARVANVDEMVTERAVNLLLSRQARDGSWNEQLHSHIMSGVTDDLAVTAYVTWALAERKTDKMAVREAVQSGLNYLESKLSERSDAYTLALAANAFAAGRPASAMTNRLLGWLESRAERKANSARWSAGRQTLTYGYGDFAGQETTALTALALLKAGGRNELTQAALRSLVQDRDASGGWGSTQATILALRALVAASGGVVEKGEATLRLSVDGKAAGSIEITESNFDVMQQLDLTPFVPRGGGMLRIEKDGTLQPLFQLITKHYTPWQTALRPARPEVEISVNYDRTKLARNEEVTANVTIRSHTKRALPMLLVDVGLAPGFTPQPESLEALKRSKRIERWETTPRQLIFYLRDLPAGKTVQLPVRLRARFPVRAQTPPAQVYEYYNPANRALSAPAKLTVAA